MPAKILELRRKISSTFNHSDSLTYVRTNWAAIDGKPTLFPPEAHDHTISEIIGLQTSLNGKANDNQVVKLEGTQTITGLKTFKQTLKLYSPSQNTDFSALRIGDRDNQYGFDIKYIGSGSGVNNLLELWADNSTGTPLKSISVDQTGLITFSKTPTVNGTDVSLVGHTHGEYLAKVTSTSSYSQVYGKATNGSQAMYNLSSSAVASTIPTRDANGQLIVKEVPTANNHAASKEYVDSIAATKQNVLGFTPVPNTRTIAGLDLTQNRSRDAIIGVNANGYVRRTGTNTYDVRTVENLKTDLGLGSAAYVTLNSSNRFVTDSQIESWNNKFDKPSGTSSQYVTGNGSLATFPTIPTKLSHLSDVSSLVTPSNGQILTYNGLSWEPSNKPSYNLGEISETNTYKRVTQSEKDIWNAKQDKIGYTPENIANKRTSIRTTGADDSSYVTELGIKNYVDTLVNSSKYSEVGATITSGRALNINDANKFFPVSSSSLVSIIIPKNSSVPFPIGTEIHFLRRGSGDVSFSPSLDVSLVSHNVRRKISDVNQMVTLKKIGTDQWVLIGALKA